MHILSHLILITHVYQANKLSFFKIEIRDSFGLCHILEIVTYITSTSLRRTKEKLDLPEPQLSCHTTHYFWHSPVVQKKKKKKCSQFSVSITFWMSNSYPIVFPHIWCASSNSTRIFNLYNINKIFWIILCWQVSKLPNTNKKIICII